MADKEEKWAENVEGAFYVDEQCIDCDLCRETSPNNFTREEDGGYSYVYKQPENVNPWYVGYGMDDKGYNRNLNSINAV